MRRDRTERCERHGVIFSPGEECGLCADARADRENDQDDWRDEMLLELLQMLGWYKMALPTPEEFKRLLKILDAQRERM